MDNEIIDHRLALDKLLLQSKEIELIAIKISDCLKQQKKVLTCGNGGSASDAQNLTTELVGRFNKERNSHPSICLSDNGSLITAIGNDYGFEKAFSRQIEGLGNEGDVLVVISTSGNSENILEAIKVAKEKSILTIGLLGKGGGKAKESLDLFVSIDSFKTSRIQELHILLIHIINEYVDREIK